MTPEEREGRAASLVRCSRLVAAWVLVSRVTGFLRIAAAGAVLGPTFFGNLFQLLGTISSLLFGMLAGSLLSAMLVPPIVRHLDACDVEAAERLAGGVLGVVIAAFLAVALAGIALAPLLLLVLTAAVQDPTIRQEQMRLGWPLLVVLLPQLLCYAASAIGIAAQQARGRFVLAAAAPAVENLGVTGVLLAFAMAQGGRAEIVPADAMLLGMGATGAVALGAALQCWGAHRAGLPLVPLPGWRQPEIRGMVRTGLSSLGYTGLSCAAYLSMLVVAAGVPGGVVAYQIANSFIQLPVALTAGAASAVHLPHLSRHGDEAARDEFARLYRSALGLVLFAVLPAGLLLLALAPTLAAATAIGQMATPAGVALLAIGIATRGPGAVGEAVVTLGTAASYARGDTGSPLRAMALFALACGAGMTLAATVAEPVLRIGLLGMAATVGSFAAAGYLHHRQMRGVPRQLNRGALAFDLGAAGVAALFAWLVARHAPALPPIPLAGAAALAAGLVYAGLHVARGSPELVLLLPVLARLQRRPAPRPVDTMR